MLDEFLAQTPKYALLELTYNCNQACPFCYCVWLKRAELYGRELPIADWKKLVQKLISRGVRHITFTGGEPLLKEGWEELLAYSRSLSAETQLDLFSNGSLVDDRVLSILKKNNVGLSLTFPGVRRLERLTGRKTSVKFLIDVVARARAFGVYVSVGIPVSTLNFHSVSMTLAIAFMAGANAASVGPVMPEGRATFHPELLLSDRQYDKLSKKTARVARFFPKRKYYFLGEKSCSCSVEENGFQFVRSGSCPAGREFFAVGPSGFFRRCLHSKANEFFWTELPDVDAIRNA